MKMWHMKEAGAIPTKLLPHQQCGDHTHEAVSVRDPVGVPCEEQNPTVSWSLVQRVDAAHVGGKFEHLE
jgi:hypothetical protein